MPKDDVKKKFREICHRDPDQSDTKCERGCITLCGAAAYASEEVAEAKTYQTVADCDLVPLQCGDKVLRSETIVVGVFEQGSIDPPIERLL